MSNIKLFSVPFDVWVKSVKLGQTKKNCITSIEIANTVDTSDNATLNIEDPLFSFIDDDIFVESNKIKIKMYPVGITTNTIDFNGYISAVDIEFPEDGVPTLKITCMDKTHKMNRKKKNNTYKNCTRAEVVRKIVTSYGFKCVVQKGYSFTREETITQSDCTDISFIQSLASEEVYPFTARLVGDTFYYVKKGTLGDVVAKVFYSKYPNNMISGSASITQESKKEEISSSKISTSTKKVSSTTGKSKGKGDDSGSADSDTTNYQDSRTYDPEIRKWSKD